MDAPYDPFDPNNWDILDYFILSALHKGEEYFCAIDIEDREHAVKYLWHVDIDPRPDRREKIYFSRMTKKTTNGNTVQKRKYLHRDICERAYGPPSSIFHTMVDHINGNSLNNRRNNLRWATPNENAKNRKKQ